MAWFSELFHRLFITGCKLLTYVPHVPKSSGSNRAHPHRAREPASINLLSLPHDVLFDIVYRVTHSENDCRTPENPPMVQQHDLQQTVALASVCRKLSSTFYSSLDNVCLSSCAVDDDVVDALCRNTARALKTLVLRRCSGITNHSLFAMAHRLHNLRSVDLSFVSSITDEGVIALCVASASRLTKLLLRQCENIGNASMYAIGKCTKLQTLDVSYCVNVTDEGVLQFALGCGRSLELIAISYNTQLTDDSLAAIGKYCTKVVQVCARGLPFVTDAGFRRLCKGLGGGVEGIDVVDCLSLTRDATLDTLRKYCGGIYSRIMPNFASKSLRQILISTLRQNIFIVHGSDRVSGSDTVHIVLVDNGDIVSASLLTSGTTDLSLLGVVLCKSFGSSLNKPTKNMLESDYGIPTSSLSE